ncbi:MAG TPA: tRNA (adenosine(37)-N6)-threonylcarbamoyltransferase complex dimerization subunit type 1 TsaB [Candidatus Limnocylindria bacterium]|nr:tRNA (adenosine(37)-N6)-threonylcarbamoyltransferase complex dimerization subunit type 1 TsaB [Candidatus Limnocylindria bacterium]
MSALREGAGWLLALDTSTSTIVVAAGTVDGTLIAAEAFEGRYRHSQELLPAMVRMIEGAGLRLADLAAVVVGTGPGAFTGLRVGIATAKTLAHELGRPLVGIPSSSALLDAVGNDAVLWLSSGPRDRVMVRVGGDPVVVPGDADVAGIREVAVDLAGRASEAALELGREAVAGLPAALLRLGAARLAAGESDDPERLVPGYASPPRGAPIEAPEGSVAWSRDPR